MISEKHKNKHCDVGSGNRIHKFDAADTDMWFCMVK